MKDQRYKAVKRLIENDDISSLKEIFTIIPLTVVRKDLKVNYTTLWRRVRQVSALTVKDVLGLAALFEVDSKTMFLLVMKDAEKGTRQRKQTSPKKSLKSKSA